MGTTNTTTGTNTSNLQFNPLAQQMYNSLIGGGGNVLQGYMQNPFGNPAYTMGAAQGQRGAQQAGANNMAALSQNALTSGLTGQAGAGFMGAQKAQLGRANQAMSSQANVQNVLSALQRQMSAVGTGLSFSPQLTGQSGTFNQQSSMQGLGTWLPQLLSAAGGAALGAGGVASGPFAQYTPGTGPSNVGSIGGMPAPQLGTMGNSGGGGTGGLPNPLLAGMGGSQYSPPSWLMQNQ